MTVDERARAGLFLAMQYPVEVPGVSVSNFLRTAATAIARRGAEAAHLGQGASARRWSGSRWTRRSPSATSTRASPAVRRSGTRSCSSSCSSRRSRSSTRPTPASTSTRCASSPRASTGSARPARSASLLITHYTRILRYIKPDFVHVFVDGRIVEEGGSGAGRPARGRGLRRGTWRREATAAVTAARARACRGDTVPRTSSASARTSRSCRRTVRDGQPLVYLDSGATSQKPRQVLDAEREFYEQHNADVAPRSAPARRGGDRRLRGRAREGRRVHRRAEPDEIVFTKNATEGINLVAYALSNAATAGPEAAGSRRSGRRDRRHRDGAPRQPRALAACCASAPARRCAGSALTDDGPARPVATSTD